MTLSGEPRTTKATGKVRAAFMVVNALDVLTYYVKWWPLIRLYVRAVNWSEDMAARRA